MVRERFSNGVAKLTTTRHNANFQYPFPPEQVIALFREFFGPTKTAFLRLDPAGQEQLARELVSLWNEHNQSSDGKTTSVQAEYLEVRVVPA